MRRRVAKNTRVSCITGVEVNSLDERSEPVKKEGIKEEEKNYRMEKRTERMKALNVDSVCLGKTRNGLHCVE